MEGSKVDFEFRLFPIFAVIVISLMSLQVSSETSEPEIIENDGRITGVIIVGGQAYLKTWTIKENEWYSVVLDCQSCTATISFNDTIIESSSTSLTGQISEDGTLKLSIESTITEEIELSIVHNILDDFDSIRPSPSQAAKYVSNGLCTEITSCLDISRGNLNSIPHGEYSSLNFITGILDDSQSEYFAIDVDKGDTLELSLVHSTSDIIIEVFMQNDSSETKLSGNLSFGNSLAANQVLGPSYWFLDKGGRVIVKVESQSPNTVWSIQRTIYNLQEATVISQHSSAEIYGHHSKSVLIDVTQAERLALNSPTDNIEVDVMQLMNGNWVSSDLFIMNADVIYRAYVYSNVSVVRLEITGPVFLIQLLSEDYSDLNQGIEAPSLMPLTKDTNNSSWPIINLDSQSYNGQFTLPIFDHSDVYRIEITGWEDSIHFVKFIIEGDVDDCEIEFVEKNQDTWGDEEVKTRTISSGKIQVALEVARGTHFLRVSIINSSLYDNSWGENIDAKLYSITTQYELVEEGEEPWFPPDDNAVKWGTIARWFLGGLFLIPGLIVFIMHKRNLRFATSLTSKKRRLEWLKKQLDEGVTTPKESRRFLKRALDSISTLEWESACEIWGDYDIEYRTQGIAIVAWKLDERLSQKKISWPLIIGINILEGDWELAALRLDSPQGEAWNVTNVHPRFLARGEEIFLDSMVQGNMTFLTIEIEGSSSCVDIELNGRVNGEPFAARIPSTLWRNSIDSEE